MLAVTLDGLAPVFKALILSLIFASVSVLTMCTTLPDTRMSPASERAVSEAVKFVEEIFSDWATLFILMLYIPGEAVVAVVAVNRLEAAVVVFDVVDAEYTLKASSTPRVLAAVLRARIFVFTPCHSVNLDL